MLSQTAEVVARVSTGVALEQIRQGRGALDFTDALVLMAISQANVEPVLRDPALNRAYATDACPPPDSLRRPITLHAVAASLAMPYETVRRRAGRLAGLGLCRLSAAGALVPGAVVKLPNHRAAIDANYDRARRLHARLLALGAAPAADPAAAPWSGPPPVRAVARATADYMLRLVAGAGAVFGDLTRAALWFEILRATHAFVPEGLGLRPDQSLPVRLVAVALEVGVAPETARRQVAALLDLGLCERVRGGLRIAAAAASRPELATVLRQNERDLMRMYASLADLGVLALWAREAPGEAPVAPAQQA